MYSYASTRFVFSNALYLKIQKSKNRKKTWHLTNQSVLMSNVHWYCYLVSSSNRHLMESSHIKYLMILSLYLPLGMLKVKNSFLDTRNFFPGTQREFSTMWWWCHTRDPELPMRPRLLVRSWVLPSCKFAASRLNIKRHYAQLQQRAFDVYCIALSREHTKNVKLRLGMLNELRIYELRNLYSNSHSEF